ncbi:aldose 1-epimerase family protein [Haloglycomyces albus]|uniref:aldose 1-epimerase family protein n=1 Tax=Haloglycomyces albus TaxID=526067 RepID=UPI00046D4DC6|nr:aldose 1-epimerase family protein [Haloglycomyces albus]
MALSGQTWTIAYGDHEVDIAAVGGSLRSYRYQGVDLIESYDDDEIAPECSGHLLAPWPSRVADGTYTFADRTHRLPINDIANNAAIHGLIQWIEWSVTESTSSSVTMELRLAAQPGYPWPLQFKTRWSIGPAGLRAAHTVSNPGATAVPFGFGAHPYIRVPRADSVDKAWIDLPAKKQCRLNSNKIPTGQEAASVDGRTPLRDVVLDNAFSEIDTDQYGTVRARLGNMDNESQYVEVWADDAFKWMVLFTSDTREGDRRRRSVAIEPMTCPPNAFVSGDDLIELGPSQAWFGVWGITPVL